MYCMRVPTSEREGGSLVKELYVSLSLRHQWIFVLETDDAHVHEKDPDFGTNTNYSWTEAQEGLIRLYLKTKTKSNKVILRDLRDQNFSPYFHPRTLTMDQCLLNHCRPTLNFEYTSHYQWDKGQQHNVDQEEASNVVHTFSPTSLSEKNAIGKQERYLLWRLTVTTVEAAFMEGAISALPH